MKRILPLLILSLVQYVSPAQRYLPEFEKEESRKLFEKAERAYVKGNYERAADFYDELMQDEGESYELVFNQLTALIHTTDTNAIENAFKKLTAYSFPDCNFLTICQDFKSIKYRKIFNLWRQAVQECQEREKKYITEQKIKLPEVRAQLLWMKVQDVESDVKVIQKLRYSAYENISFDSLREYRNRIYQENFAQLLLFVEKHGWLVKDLVGEDGAEAAWLIAQHADHAPVEQARLLPKLKAAVDAGGAPMRHYAYLFDQVCANYRQPQRFGTLRWKNPNTGKWELYPLEDPEKVDEYRKEAGLPPLKRVRHE